MIRAKMAAVKLGMALQEQMASGEVQVEQRDGAVVVTVGAGGAFASGSADMTEQAKAIIQKLEDVSGKAQRIVVTAGAWATKLLADIGVPLRVMRQTLPRCSATFTGTPNTSRLCR